MIQVQNVTFLPKNNMILIARGMKKTWLSHTEGGNLVIKMKGYDKYWFDPDTGSVFSRKNSKSFSPLKKQTEEKKHYFWLYQNGVKVKVYFFEILRDNMTGIENFVRNKYEKNMIP